MLDYNLADTIAAVSTPPGNSALGIVRVSGAEACARARELFAPDGDFPPGRGAVAGKIRWTEGGRALAAPGVLYLMPGPRSYTGEDTAEIIVPGAAALLQRLLELLVSRGVRRAAAGEFTWRAFFHGRLNLTEVGAVAELISTADRENRRAAADVLHRGASGRLRGVRDELRVAAALVEQEIDFSEDETPPEFFAEMAARLGKIREKTARALEATARAAGRGEGLAVGLAGLTNAGKSSLFNRLLGREAAIVAAERSTTRDVLAQSLELDGVRILLCDRPGGDDCGSALARRLDTRDAGDGGYALLVLVVDARAAAPADLAALGSFLRRQPPARALLVYNKCDGCSGAGERENSGVGAVCPADAVAPAVRETVRSALRDNPGVKSSAVLEVSAVTGAGMPALRQALAAAAATDCGAAQAAADANGRARAALAGADAAIARAGEYLETDGNLEFAAFELRDAYQTLSALSGEVYSEDVLDGIFSRFCVGK